MFYRMFICTVVVLVLSGCGGSSTSLGPTEETIHLASFKYPCFDESQRLCLVEEAFGEGELPLFYQTIKHFNYVWGSSYELSVRVEALEEVGEDGFDHTYSLIEVVSRTEDSVGTLYRMELVELLESTFTKTDDQYFFLGKAFECMPAVDCDGLVAINNGGGLVNVVFQYLGNGRIALMEWN